MPTWKGALLVAIFVGACGGQPPASPGPSSPSPLVTNSRSPSPSPSPGLEPGEMRETFAADLEPRDLPVEELVPNGADVTGRWFGTTDLGAVVLVAWVEPGSDFSRLPGGFAMWVRYDSPPHWRAGLVQRHDADEAIQGIDMSTTDLTGDRSDDALVFEGVGGSGACGRWLVIDLIRREETFRREICDGRIDPGPPGAPGLVLTESVYREGDAHCCPSAMRETTLRWSGRVWRVTGKKVIEN